MLQNHGYDFIILFSQVTKLWPLFIYLIPRVTKQWAWRYYLIASWPFNLVMS